MASIDDLVRRGGNLASPGGAPAVRSQVPVEGLRTYTPEQLSQLGAPKAPLQIGGPSPVPTLQAPMYTPPGAPQLGAGRPVAGIGGPSQVPALQAPLYTPEGAPRIGAGPQAAGIGGPSANLPARQAPMYTPEQMPRLGASPAASGIGAPPAAASAAPAEAAGPLARAAGLAGKLATGLGVGIAADQALRAVDPQDNMGSWIDKNVPGASWLDNAASHIGLGRSYAEQGIAKPTAQAASAAPAVAAGAAKPAGAQTTPSTNPQSTSPSPGYADELQRVQAQAAAEQPEQLIADGAPPQSGAQSGGGQPPDVAQGKNPIAFMTYGAAQGANGGSGALISNKDGTQVPLDQGQPLPADVQAFNALHQQASQQPAEPVQIIRGMDQTTAIPNGKGNPMQEVPTDVANAGPEAVSGFLAARKQNALNQADPLKAQTDAKIREQMVTQGMGDPGAPGAAGAGAASTEGLSGDDYLKTLQPQRAALIKSIIGGGMQVSPFTLAKNPGLMSQVAQADPSFDVKDMNARNKLVSSIKAGPDSENIKSINTAISHVNGLNDSMTNLHNGDRAWVNSAANWLSDNVSGNHDIQDAIASTETHAKGVAGEMAKVFRSSGMSQGEIDDWKKSFSTATTPTAQHATIASALDMLKGRMDAINEKYTNGMGPNAAPLKLLTPENQVIFDKLSGKAPALDAGTKQSDAKTPSTYTPNQKSIAHLKAHPETRADFDDFYGKGASASILGK